MQPRETVGAIESLAAEARCCLASVLEDHAAERASMGSAVVRAIPAEPLHTRMAIEVSHAITRGIAGNRLAAPLATRRGSRRIHGARSRTTVTRTPRAGSKNRSLQESQGGRHCLDVFGTFRCPPDCPFFRRGGPAETGGFPGPVLARKRDPDSPHPGAATVRGPHQLCRHPYPLCKQKDPGATTLFPCTRRPYSPANALSSLRRAMTA